MKHRRNQSFRVHSGYYQTSVRNIPQNRSKCGAYILRKSVDTFSVFYTGITTREKHNRLKGRYLSCSLLHCSSVWVVHIVTVMSAIRKLFHGLTALHYFYAMYFDLYVIDEYPREIKELFGGLASNEKYKLPLKGRVIFLTYWGLVSESLFVHYLKKGFF